MCADKIKLKRRNLMMERSNNAEDVVYQRRKAQFLTYGRALLTISLLGILTLVLYALTHATSEVSANVIQTSESNKVISKRHANDDEIVPKTDSNQVSSYDNDNQHIKLFRRQQMNNDVVHRHTDDGGIYVFKGYKCVPIRKTSKLELLRQKAGMWQLLVLYLFLLFFFVLPI